jgi:hypothetical protein
MKPDEQVAAHLAKLKADSDKWLRLTSIVAK